MTGIRERGDARRTGLPTVRAVLVLLSISAAPLAFPDDVSAQTRIWLSNEGRYGRPINDGLPEALTGFTFCRLWYRASRSMESGLGWSTDYPAADVNFITRLAELTPTKVARWPNGDPGFAAMEATDPEIFKCPFLFMSDPGSVDFSDREVEALHEYLMRGGFLWADDMWGNRAWSYFERNITRIVPEYPITEITPGHPIYSVLYSVENVPQIPSAQSWRRSGGQTSEFGAETAVPHLRGIFDEEGRLLVAITFNTDIADGWEREGNEPHYFYNFSPRAYGLAINIILFAMSH